MTFLSSLVAKVNDEKNARQAMHAALITANGCFGVGAVVGALGLPATHPLAFALVREFVAGLVLLRLSAWFYQKTETEYHSPKQKPTDLWGWTLHWKTFALLGLVVFGNQTGFLVGIKLAGPVTASVWQPSQPVFTAAICMALGWEPVQPKRVAGVLVASLGCIVMVVLKGNDDTETADSHSTSRYLIGNSLFFLNCLCTSLYVILSKRLLAIYPPLLVSAWSYNFASAFMLVAAIVSSLFPWSHAFFCPECDPNVPWWFIPLPAVPALLYYICFGSVAAYGLITWANQHATGTLVMSYTVLQPVVSALLTSLLLISGVVVTCQSLLSQITIAMGGDKEELQRRDAVAQACLDPPGWGTLCGMVGVFVGLALIVSTEPTKDKSAKVHDDDDLRDLELRELDTPLMRAGETDDVTIN